DNMLSAGIRMEAKEAMFEEYRRLLYVAMTRAEDALYICGAANSEKANEKSWYALMEQALSPLGAKCETPAGMGIRIGSLPSKKMKKERSTALEKWDDKNFSFLTTPPPVETTPPKPLTPSHAGEEPSAA